MATPPLAAILAQLMPHSTYYPTQPNGPALPIAPGNAAPPRGLPPLQRNPLPAGGPGKASNGANAYRSPNVQAYSGVPTPGTPQGPTNGNFNPQRAQPRLPMDSPAEERAERRAGTQSRAEERQERSKPKKRGKKKSSRSSYDYMKY